MLLVVLICGVYISTAVILLHHSNLYLKRYEDNQRHVNREVANQIELLLDYGCDSDAVYKEVQQLDHSVFDEHSCFFLVEDEQWLFVKDKETTAEYKEKNLSVADFMKELEKAEMIVTSEQVEKNQSHYIIGIAMDKERILEETGIQLQHTYVLISNGILSVTLLLSLLYMQEDNKAQALQIEDLKGKLQTKNHAIEILTKVQTTASEAPSKAGAGAIDTERYSFSNYGFLVALLNGSENEQLRPCTILLIRVQSITQQYSNDELQEMMAPIRELVGRQSVFIELNKGEYGIFTYKMSKREVEQLEKAVHKKLEDIMKANSLTYHSYMDFEKEEPREQSVTKRFYDAYQKM